MRVGLISLEPWDDIWRRNQHLSTELTSSGFVESVMFIEPPTAPFGRTTVRSGGKSLTIVSPSLRVPKRAGGLVDLGAMLRRTILADVDVLWINDPCLGVHCIARGRPSIYDITDDWRSYPFPPRILRRIVRAENRLATRSSTIVCSLALRERWCSRYGVDSVIINNGIDANLWESSQPYRFSGPGPHVGYVGTVQSERMDVPLVLSVASDQEIGSLHLIGPIALDPSDRRLLEAHPKIKLHGAVKFNEVPSKIKGLDVLLSPHLVNDFTLSLDAIKSYEYLASGRPVVATPTSGFQIMAGRQALTLAPREEFVSAVRTSLGHRPQQVDATEHSWGSRAMQFAQALRACRDSLPGSGSL